MSYRYVISDLDGTLLNERGELSPYTLEVLHRLQDAGVGIIAASGRLTASVLPFTRAIGTPLPLIAANGAVIADAQTGAPIQTDCVPLDCALEIARMLEAEGRYLQCYDVDPVICFYCAEELPISATYARAVHMEACAVGRISDFLEKRGVAPPKLLAIVEAADLPELLGRLQRKFAGRLTITNSNDHFVEITGLGVTKGKALRTLCERLGASPTEVIAFGDAGNDEPMLATAGMGVAMANAHPSLQMAASRLCESNKDDGVARFLARLILGDRID